MGANSRLGAYSNKYGTTCLFVTQIYGLSGAHIYARLYLQSRKERKYTWQKTARTSFGRNGCKCTWEKTAHTYRVIILKQMADHTTRDVFNCLFPLDVQNELQLLLRVFCYSWLVCLLGFWLKNTSHVKVGNLISDGIVIVFHLA